MRNIRRPMSRRRTTHQKSRSRLILVTLKSSGVVLLLPSLIVFASLCTPIAIAQKNERPTPPTRDPHTAGYVKAKELPDGAVPATDVDGSFIIGRTHEPALEAALERKITNGTVVEFTMNSADSKFYPGIMREPNTFGAPDPHDPAKLIVTTSHPAPYTRKVEVYVPRQYVAGNPAPFIVSADGPDRRLFAVLDALISEHKVPAMIAFAIANGGGDAQGSERGLEYDTMSGRYAELVEQEVLPRV